MSKTKGLSGAAAVLAVVAVSVTLKAGEAVDVLAVVAECNDAGVCKKVQKSYRCTAIGDGGLDCQMPEGAVIAPGTVSAPYASLGSAKELQASEVKSPCACADQRKDSKLCEALVTEPGGKSTWVKAPRATTLQSGQWRGAGCLPADCWETDAREECGGPGCMMREECR